MTHRYYSTQRPVQIGGYPASEHVVEIHNFDNREYCEEIGQEAWGYIDYDTILDAKDVYNYELIMAGQKRKYEIAVIRYGFATIEAKSEDEARQIVIRTGEDIMNWDPIRNIDISVIDEGEVGA